MRQAGSGHKHIRGQALRDGCDPRKYQKPRIGGGGLRHISNRPGLDGERASALGAEMGRGRNTVDIIQGVYVFQVRDRPSCEPRTLLQRDALCEGHVEAAVVPEAEADADAAAERKTHLIVHKSSINDPFPSLLSAAETRVCGRIPPGGAPHHAI